jgi:hypothetical protein
MSVIVGLKEKEYVMENIGEFGLFMMERNGIPNPSIGREYKTEILDKLEREFKKYDRNKVVITTQEIDLVRKVYSDFFEQICATASCSAGEEPHKYTASKWTFFTTNYDNAIEDYMVNHRKYRYLDLGFRDMHRKRVMDAERFVENNSRNDYVAMIG